MLNLPLLGCFSELQWALVQSFLNDGCESLMVYEVIVLVFNKLEIHTHTHTHTHTQIEMKQ